MHTVVETAEFQKQAKAVERCRARSVYRLDRRQSRCMRCHSRRGRSAQGALEPCWNVLLVMVYAKAVQANVKPKDIKRG
jgi:uncharacterized paraquat-inducible protein A